MRRGFCFFIILIFLFSFSNTSAYSNVSIEAKQNVEIAKDCLDYLIEEGMPYERANETYYEALETYETKMFCEIRGISADFTLANEYSEEVCSIKDSALKARDELTVFLGYYNNSAQKFNLSSMEEDYQEILDSYDGERFEETPSLINLGYSKLSEIESSQTTLNLFYQTTTQTLKNFFINNWLQILIFFGILLLLFLIFKTSIALFLTSRKIKQLELEKISLFELIKKTQKAYFDSKTMSEIEFSVKIKTFKNMIRDIDRRIPELRERLIKLKRDKSILKRVKNEKKK